jgi:hypothetical protein
MLAGQTSTGLVLPCLLPLQLASAVCCYCHACVQVAAAVGIPAEDVHAGIKPAGKAALVEKLKAQVRPAAAVAAICAAVQGSACYIRRMSLQHRCSFL